MISVQVRDECGKMGNTGKKDISATDAADHSQPTKDSTYTMVVLPVGKSQASLLRTAQAFIAVFPLWDALLQNNIKLPLVGRSAVDA